MSRPNLDQDDPTVIRDDTPFPVPELYFKVYDSEKDEPDAKIRQDVYKLYERWQQKYGRRWPENGMNTEDMVWLYEEAYKEKPGPGEGTSSSAAGPGSTTGAAGTSGGAAGKKGAGRRVRAVPIEKEEYPGEFVTATEDLEDAARERLAKMTPAQAKQAAEQAKAEIENANYVTDEFESEEVEMGNLEQLYGTYLFDRDGKPTYLPSEPAQEAMGEESEDWADFYGSVRPRHVDTEEVREAVWATDEFESDEDNTESEWDPEYVGAGLGLKHEDPLNPQWSLRHSNHPLAPFPGEALKWSSFLYDDGTSYEGLTREAIAHGMGVMTFGNGTGGGFHIRDVARGDKYEGEFQAGYAHGLGMFTSPSSGEVYIGEFFAGQRHGCGIKINMKPFYFLMERGVEPREAYQATYDRIMRNIEFRTWYHGTALGDANEDEHVLFAVKDDLGNPYDSLAKAAVHDAKLKRWRELSPEDKAMDRVLTVLERVTPGGRAGSSRGNALGVLLNEDGDSSDGDSIDLMVGNTTDGGPGYGWNDDTDSELHPMDSKLREQMAAEAVDAKADEQAAKEELLGGDVLNVFTGLSLADYLEGRELEHNQLAAELLGQDESSFLRDLESDEGAELAALGAGGYTQHLISKNMEAYERANAEDNPYARRSRYEDRNWASEDTDTRFETESDMMELCDLAEILGTIDEAEEIVARARMWRWKPYGEVTLRTAQDAVGAPLELMQDPLHYPHGTKFMAPGPLGQCHPLPEDPNMRVEMARVARNYQHVHDLYNFDYEPEPGSAQYKVDQRIKRAQELQLRRLQRMAMDAAAELRGGEPGVGPQPQAELAEAAPGSSGDSSRHSRDSSSSSSSSSSRQVQGAPAPWATQAGTPFASMSMGIGRASRVVLKTLQSAAKHTARRPRLARPSQMSGARKERK